MIVSHEHKFIFIKPTKVAGTSLEIALAKQCGPDDIITPISKFDPTSDSTAYEHPAQNYEAEGFYNHMTPAEIRERVGESVWNDYYKFTVVRNPWDLAVSRYYWQQRHGTSLTKLASPKKWRQRLFEPAAYVYVLRRLARHVQGMISRRRRDPFWLFLGSFRSTWTNDQFYFDEQGAPVCDHYLRYEDIEASYRAVCERLGLPYEPLPHTKNKLRADRAPVEAMYDEETESRVAQLFATQIETFGFSSPRQTATATSERA